MFFLPYKQLLGPRPCSRQPKRFRPDRRRKHLVRNRERHPKFRTRNGLFRRQSWLERNQRDQIDFRRDTEFRTRLFDLIPPKGTLVRGILFVITDPSRTSTNSCESPCKFSLAPRSFQVQALNFQSLTCHVLSSTQL
jgi:hypothetical protein